MTGCSPRRTLVTDSGLESLPRALPGSVHSPNEPSDTQPLPVPIYSKLSGNRIVTRTVRLGTHSGPGQGVERHESITNIQILRSIAGKTSTTGLTQPWVETPTNKMEFLFFLTTSRQSKSPLQELLSRWNRGSKGT